MSPGHIRMLRTPTPGFPQAVEILWISTRVGSVLAGRAEDSRPLCEQGRAKARPAPDAWTTGSSVDGVAQLGPTGPARGVEVVPERRSTVSDGGGENFPDRRGQAIVVGSFEPVCTA